MITSVSFFIIHVFLILSRATFSKLFKILSEFPKFGIPQNVDFINRRIELSIKVLILYAYNIIFLYAFVGILRINTCKKLRTGTNTRNVCGIMVNVLLPFDIDYFPAKQIYWFVQVISTIYVIFFALNAFMIVLCTAEHVILRIDHLMDKLDDIFLKPQANVSIVKLKECVLYHNHIIG